MLSLKDRSLSVLARVVWGALRKVSILSRVVYALYERKLVNEVKGGRIPLHVGIIPDGNRRWAASKGLQLHLGHEVGYEKVKQVLNWLWDLGVKVVTIYAMSTENCLHRPPDERRRLFKLAERGLREMIEDKSFREKGVSVRVIGRVELLPPELRQLVERVNAEFSSGSRHLNIALCYGGRQEIVEAAKRIARDVSEGKLAPEDINEEVFRSYLYTNGLPDPDLVIRTSGEERISNFLLWQTAYSELYFCEAFWPDFRRIDLLRAIRSYQRRERRFGR